jgi:hypothetical protein
MTTAAQLRAFRKLQLTAIAGLKHLQIGFIVTIEAQVVAVVAPMTHDNIGVLLRDEQIVLGIEAQGWRLVPLMAGVTVKVRKVGFRTNELSVRNADRRVARE